MWTCGWIHKAHTCRGLYVCMYTRMVLCGVCTLRSLELSQLQELAQICGSSSTEVLVHPKKASTDTVLQERLKQLQAPQWRYPFGNLGFTALVSPTVLSPQAQSLPDLCSAQTFI